tara:strand:+ start:3629 stop:4624 length:996 start_codon:yes stop_codon:yes gene_type:complete
MDSMNDPKTRSIKNTNRKGTRRITELFRNTSNNIFLNLGKIIVIIVFFIIILYLFLIILGSVLSPPTELFLIKGKIPGSSTLTIKQNNINTRIIRSNNKKQGIEYTWSVWLYIDNIDITNEKYYHIFHKGDNAFNNKFANEEPMVDGMNIPCSNGNGNQSNALALNCIDDNSPYDSALPSQGINFPNNSPGVYLSPNSNELLIVVNVFNNIMETVVIKNIPIKKWINLMIRVESNMLDIYINGTLSNSHKLSGVPKQNYGNVYIGSYNNSGTFPGEISCLRYWAKALSPGDIVSVVEKGPCLNDINVSKTDNYVPPFLSSRFFTADISFLN